MNSNVHKAKVGLNPPKNPPPVYLVKRIEREFAIRERRMAEEQHGPVRILMQGGKKCNIVIE